MLVTAVFRPTLNIVGINLVLGLAGRHVAQIDLEREALGIEQRQQRARTGDFDFNRTGGWLTITIPCGSDA